MAGQIRTKILTVILSTSLGAVLLLSVTGMTSILNMRRITLSHSDQLGNTAAEESQSALETQALNQLMSLVQDRAALADEKLLVIQNQTRMIAGLATQIYTNKNQYAPKFIDFLQPSQAGQLIPHVSAAAGITIAQFRDEIYRAANIGDTLQQMAFLDTGFGACYIGTESGFSIIVEKGAPPLETKYDARTRSWYRGAKEKEGLFWTDIFTDANTNAEAITCAMPFYDLSNGGKVFMGVAGSGALISENVNKIIDSTKIGETGHAFILNEAGHVIISPKNRDIAISDTGFIIGEDYLGSEDPALRELARRMVSRESGLMELDLYGRNVYVAYHPLSAIDWSLGVVAAIDEIIAPAKRIEQEILTLTRQTLVGIDQNILAIVLAVVLVIVIAAAVTIFLAIRLSNSLTAPILSLSKGAMIIGAGDLSHRLDVKTGDEIEMLADTFNRMIADIKQITGEKERIGAELTIATKIQASMLPGIFPAFPDREEFDVYASMLPAKEVGGDFYDFFLVEKNLLAILIADVSGKGVPAALFMVIAKTLIKNNAQYGLSPKEVFATVNNLLCANNEEGMFVTAFMGFLDVSSGTFTCVNAGHNPPLIKRGDRFEWLKIKPGLFLGGMENMTYQQEELELKSGDMVYLYTDGVTEAMNPQREQFSESRLLEAVDAHKDCGLKEFAVSIKDAIDTFAEDAEQADDITMLVLKYKGLPVMKELKIEARTENLNKVLDFVKTELEAAKCPPKIQKQLFIAVEEVFVNISYYAYNPETGSALVRIKSNENEIWLEFEDSGKPYNPLEKADPDITVPAEDRPVGGLGIFMVKQLMDWVEYRHENNKNILKIKKFYTTS
jgi:sigma-B regulation protein RsbU (phosphoserine phosphatase)